VTLDVPAWPISIVGSPNGSTGAGGATQWQGQKDNIKALIDVYLGENIVIRIRFIIKK
jgi:hypothetical protein